MGGAGLWRIRDEELSFPTSRFMSVLATHQHTVENKDDERDQAHTHTHTERARERERFVSMFRHSASNPNPPS